MRCVRIPMTWEMQPNRILYQLLRKGVTPGTTHFDLYSLLVQNIYCVTEFSAPIKLLYLLNSCLLCIEAVPVPYQRTCIHHKHSWLRLIVILYQIVQTTSFSITTPQLIFPWKSFPQRFLQLIYFFHQPFILCPQYRHQISSFLISQPYIISILRYHRVVSISVTLYIEHERVWCFFSLSFFIVSYLGEDGG